MRSLFAVILAVLAAATVACGGDQLMHIKTCDEDPTQASCQPPPDCTPGTVTGRVCAPDAKTFVAGAEVFSTGECGGQPFSAHAVADADGRFTLTLPEGERTLLAVSGSFQRSYKTTIAKAATTALPDDTLCFGSKAAKLAVITGLGDKIETLLTTLGLEFDLYNGKDAAFSAAGGGKGLLTDPDKLAQYDVVFIDCGAGRNNGKLDLGSDSQKIGANLKAFVENGGSLYASDWAFLYVHLAFSEVRWRTKSGTVALPFDTTELMGYAPQTIDATVLDQPLASYLRKDAVTVAFPPNNSVHWGLIDSVSGTASVLIKGDAKLCDGSKTCAGSRGVARGAPLAVLLDRTIGQPGGAVIYTSFHNKDTPDSAEILKYLIFKL
jgi:hypothetical protein